MMSRIWSAVPGGRPQLAFVGQITWRVATGTEKEKGSGTFLLPALSPSHWPSGPGSSHLPGESVPET